MIKTLIVGIYGGMGKTLYKNAKDYGFDVLCGVDIKESDSIGCPVYKTFDEVNESVDLVIDFSSPLAFDGVIKYATENKCALFYGTTGLNESCLKKITEASKLIPVFLSYNTSPLINIALKIVKSVSETGQYDIEIIEKHRKLKKDAPSGTALAFKKQIQKADNARDVPIHSIRAGNIIGEHEIMFVSDNEILSVKHQALSKEVFSKNALCECLFLMNKHFGLYTMEDYINESAKAHKNH